MDYTNLNFKHILVILNRKDLRSQLIDFIEFNQLDIKVKYTNSYFEAAKYIENEKAEPINHIIMGFQGQGQKFIDFISFIALFIWPGNQLMYCKLSSRSGVSFSLSPLVFLSLFALYDFLLAIVFS